MRQQPIEPHTPDMAHRLEHQHTGSIFRTKLCAGACRLNYLACDQATARFLSGLLQSLEKQTVSRFMGFRLGYQIKSSGALRHDLRVDGLGAWAGTWVELLVWRRPSFFLVFGTVFCPNRFLSLSSGCGS